MRTSLSTSRPGSGLALVVCALSLWAGTFRGFAAPVDPAPDDCQSSGIELGIQYQVMSTARPKYGFWEYVYQSQPMKVYHHLSEYQHDTFAEHIDDGCLDGLLDSTLATETTARWFSLDMTNIFDGLSRFDRYGFGVPEEIHCGFEVHAGGLYGTPEASSANCELATDPECCEKVVSYTEWYRHYSTNETATHYEFVTNTYYITMWSYIDSGLDWWVNYGSSWEHTLSDEYTSQELIGHTINDVKALEYPGFWEEYFRYAYTELLPDELWNEEMWAQVQKMKYRFHFAGTPGVTYLIRWEEVTLWEDGGTSTRSLEELVPGAGEDTYSIEHEVLPPSRPGIIFVANATITEAGTTDGGPERGCASCGGGEQVPGEGILTGAGVRVALSLGSARFGVSASSLVISEGEPSPALATPETLQYLGSRSDVEVIRLGGWLRQVKAPQTLANILTNSYQYQVQFYLPSQVGSKVSGIYQLTGSPFVTWTVRNPNGTTNYSALEITKSTTSLTNQWLYSWDAQTREWQVSTPGNLRQEESTLVWDGLADLETQTHYVRDGSGNAVRKVVLKNQVFAGGYPSRYAVKPVEERVGPDGAPLVTTYLYDSSNLGSTGHVPLVWRIDSSGAWDYFEYDPNDDDRLIRKVSSFLNVGTNAVPNNLNQCRVVDYEYDPATAVPGSGDDGSIEPNLPRRTIETLLGQEVSRSYRVFLANERRDIRCQTSGAAWNASDNLVTVTRTYPTGSSFQGKLKSVDHPEGTRQAYFYSTNATQMTTTVLSGQADGASATNVVLGTKTIAVVGVTGQMLSRTIQDLPSQIVTASETYGNFDEFNRPRLTTYLDGSTSAIDYACCGPDNTIDRDGTVTQFYYDTLGRQTANLRAGVTSTNVLDAAGAVLVAKRIGWDLWEIVQRRASYDLAGRLLTETNALGGVTSYSESPDGQGQTVRTTTYPDGGTRIETYFKDGQLAKVTDTAAHPVRYEYGVESGKRYTKEIQLTAGGSDTSEWTKTYQDFAGRTEKTLYPDTAYSQSFYNPAGQMWKSRDPDDVITLYRFNGIGEAEYTVAALTATARGFTQYSTFTNQFETLKSGTDRISRTESSVLYNSTLGVNVRRMVNSVWATNNSNVPVAMATNDVSTDGLRSWQVTWSGAVALTNRTARALPDASKYVYLTNTAPDGSFTVTKSQYGRVLEVTRKNSGGSQIGKTTYAYDSHGRQSTVTDARNGATTYSFNAADLVSSVTTPAPGTGQPAQTTSTAYNLMLQATNVVYADGTSLTNEFYPSGELKRTYGSRTYPVGYGYSPQGRLTTMTNWMTFDPAGAGSGARVTTWEYDTVRGWLKKKIYAGETDSTTDYDYKSSGRLWKRYWERGVTATYTYNNAGDLSTLVYSDGTTPNLTNDYDRRGRRSTVYQGTNTTTFVYDDASQLLRESHTAGVLSGLWLTNSYDTYLRRSRLYANTAPAFTNLYGYDTASRLSGITNSAFSAGYTYLANSPLVDQIAFKQSGTPRMTTTRQWDFLNRLGSIGSVPAATNQLALSYGYLYNDANQRVRVSVGDGSFWVYAYDVLGQLISGKRYWNDGTPVPGQQFEYGFDDIGNRTVAKAGGDAAGGGLRSASYTNNLANQLTSRGVPGGLDVVGVATSGASVTVNSSPADNRRGEYFQELVTIGNTTAPQWTLVTVTASQGGTNTSQSGYAYVPRTPELFGHDASSPALTLTLTSHCTDASSLCSPNVLGAP